MRKYKFFLPAMVLALLTLTIAGTFGSAAATNTSSSTGKQANAAPAGSTDQWLSFTPNLPETRIRSTAKAWNNKLYILGGRLDNTTYRDNVLVYDIAGGTWSTSAATFPTVNMANPLSAVLSDTNGAHIYVIGGSGPSSDFAEAGRLYQFTPGAPDTITELTTDRWPAHATNDSPELAGGGAVINNKWYVFGGFWSDGGTTLLFDNRTWVFDPNGVAGSRWSLLPSATLSEARSYIGGIGVDGKVYAIGGHIDDGSGALTDSATVEALDPTIVSPTWTLKAPIPTARGGLGVYGYNTGAGTSLDGKIATAGGVFTTIDTAGYVYDIATDTWSTYASLITARRNFGYTQYNGVLYALGGLSDGGNTFLDTNEKLILSPAGAATPTPAVTATSVPPTATATPMMTSTPVVTMTMTPVVTATATSAVPTATATFCPNPFSDITGNTFYNAIMYLYCRGVVNGTDATHYGPAGTSTRAQFAKVVVLGFALPNYTPGAPDFTDVPANYFAYSFIEAGYHAGILSGYDQGTCNNIGAQFPCYGPNRPITRAQLTKLVVSAGNCPAFTPTTPTFVDVLPNNVFYGSIETAHHAGVINGYPDNTFRPNNNIRRDEMAQIVYKGILNCPGYSATTPTPAVTNTPAATATPGMAMVTISNFAYTPAIITVTVGTTVMWHNSGSAHTVTSDVAGQFDSGNIAGGADYSFQFTTAGTYAYHCEYHANMHGTVIVLPAARMDDGQ